MKRENQFKLCLLILVIVVLITIKVKGAPPFQTVTWAFFWDQPTNMPVLASYVPGTNQAYKVYGTTTLGTPQANWPVITLFTNWTLITNLNGSISLSNNLTLPFAPQYFFTLNPTNVWGEPPFSLNYWALAMSGPAWSTINNQNLNRQGP